MKFRPCIDLHQGRVKQIVGSTLETDTLKTNFISDHPPAYFAEIYKKYNLTGGHIVKLGPGNDMAAAGALMAYPNAFRLGGGVDIDNANLWLTKGAAAVILSSYLFTGDHIDYTKLKAMQEKVGSDKIVIDLSCGLNPSGEYVVYYQGWQKTSRERLDAILFEKLQPYCSGFLIHNVDTEGKCQGIETNLIHLLSQVKSLNLTYAGGISTNKDLEALESIGQGQIDFTIGSALDLFGGKGFLFEDIVKKYG